VGGETRSMVFGKTDGGRLLTVVFTVRASLVRIISARTMRKEERERYEQG
jgi:uncharacterized protein